MQTPANNKETSPYTFEEKNFAEFPIGLVGERPPLDKVTNQPVKTFSLEQFISKSDGTKVLQSWKVAGSDIFGLPRGFDLCLFFLLMQIWHEQGYENKVVEVGRIYRMLARMGLPDTAQYYQRVRDGLDRLMGTTIYTEHAIFDKKNNVLIPRLNFNILDNEFDYDEHGMIKPAGELGRFNRVTFTDAMLFLVKNGHFKPTDVERYWRLPTPRCRRVFQYLDNRRMRGKKQQLPLYVFAKKTGTHDQTLKGYKPKDIRKIYEPDLTYLVEEEAYLEGFTWRKVGNRSYLEITHAGDESEWIILNDHDRALVSKIIDTFNDHKSKRYFERAISELGHDVVREVFAQVQRAMSAGRVENPGKLFVSIAQKKRASVAASKEKTQKIKTCQLCDGGIIYCIDKTGSTIVIECQHSGGNPADLRAWLVAKGLRLEREGEVA